MSNETNMALTREFMERAFNQGDLEVVDEQLGGTAVDHQEPAGVNFTIHLKQVITAFRTAFPDLHFEIHQMLADDDIVAFRSTMTGTHQGVLQLGPGPGVPPTGRSISVAHMHFVKFVDGKGVDLWHVWDNLGLLQQIGVLPGMRETAVSAV
ncbi:MAG: ester cyclase [Chloroflexi bacterium]|nr:ester cyclase [Chloroflexota bacterium]